MSRPITRPSPSRSSHRPLTSSPPPFPFGFSFFLHLRLIQSSCAVEVKSSWISGNGWCLYLISLFFFPPVFSRLCKFNKVNLAGCEQKADFEEASYRASLDVITIMIRPMTLFGHLSRHHRGTRLNESNLPKHLLTPFFGSEQNDEASFYILIVLTCGP